ncbi:hypothetical protein MWH03_00530 [Klebsiella pneumoniae]|nr:hypothetical protein [Klebsiella pneumoniae]
MKYSVIALALLLAGCDAGVKPTPENIAKAFQPMAEAALKQEAPGDLKKTDFSIVVYTPDKMDKSDAEDGVKVAFVFMCGRVAGRDAAGWRDTEEPVIIRGAYSYTENKLEEGQVFDTTLVNRLSDRTDRSIAENRLNEKCTGQPFTLADINYEPHIISLK